MSDTQASKAVNAAHTRATEATRWLYDLVMGKKLVFVPGYGWVVPLNPENAPHVESLRNFGVIYQSEDNWFAAESIVAQLKKLPRKTVIAAAPPNTERPSNPPPSSGNPLSTRGSKPRTNRAPSVRPRADRRSGGFYA